jgi:hypothetical protein
LLSQEKTIKRWVLCNEELSNLQKLEAKKRNNAAYKIDCFSKDGT